jgi:protein-S-isoprenylcysteine O-methyltransferase Ste14
MKKPSRRAFLYWLLVFGVLAFAIPETIAIFNDESGDTLTDSIRWVVTAHPLFTLAFLVFIGWFTWHILWEKPQSKDPE